MTDHTIQNLAILAKLRISSWTATKQDSKLSQEVAQKHEISANSGRYLKKLAQDIYLEEYNREAQQARQFHTNHTLPWGDKDGTRLLPSTMFMEYREGISEFRRKLEKAANNFCDRYESVVIPRAQEELKTAFNPADYPTTAMLRSKFAIDINFMPIPEGGTGDWPALLQKFGQELKTGYEQQLIEVQQGGIIELWERLGKRVEAVADRLSNESNIFRDSLIENLEDVVAIAEKLNLFGDQDLTDALNLVKTGILCHSPDTLRADLTARSQACNRAEQVFDIVQLHI